MYYFKILFANELHNKGVLSIRHLLLFSFVPFHSVLEYLLQFHNHFGNKTLDQFYMIMFIA